MTVRARSSLLAVGATSALVVGLLGGAPAQADVGVPVPLFTSTPTTNPQVLQPLSQTAAGLVYRADAESGVWIKPTGGTAVYEDGFEFPDVHGDLISSWSDDGTVVEWRTIADATVHSRPLGAGQEVEGLTPRGFVTQRGDGPYELVHVDLLAGGTETVVGTATGAFHDVLTGPLGAMAYVGGANPRYFAYATPGTGRAIIHAEPYYMCDTVTRTHQYCWGDEGLARISLATGATATTADEPDAITETTGGVAYTEPVWTSETEQYTLRSWSKTSSSSTRRLDASFGLTGATGPTTVADAVLVSRGGPLGRAGIWSIPLPTGTSTLLEEAPAQNRRAGTIALSPGSVAWTDNQSADGSVWTRDIDGSTVLGAERLVATGTTGELLSVGAGRFAYSDVGSFGWGGTRLVDGDSDTQVNDLAFRSVLSGDRLLSHTETSSGSELWQLHDLRTGEVANLPSALDYDLWGDRLVRLRGDGAVLVGDLRTGGPAVQVRAATPADFVYGAVHIAGDKVAWSVYADDSFLTGTPDVQVRDLVTMSPAVTLTGMDFIGDLSTGYAVGWLCAADDICPLSAVSLDDQTATEIGSFWSGAVDGNTAAYAGEDGVPTLLELPTYADAPRLLGAPAATAEAGAGRTWTARVVASRLLTECAVEITDAADAVVRTLDCLDPHAAATVTWNGRDGDGALVPAGEYGWRIAGAAGLEDLVDYDGSTDALSGTVTVVADPVPTVTRTSPADTGMAVSTTANITATFSEPVKGVTGTSFRLVDGDGDGDTVPAVVTNSTATRTATLNPTASLAPDTEYLATLIGGSSAIRDGVEGPLATTSWTFTTGPAPTVTGTYPAAYATNVTTTGNVVVAFSEPVTGVDGTTVQLKKDGGATVTATASYNPTSRKVTLDPAVNLSPDGRYTVTVTGGVHGITDLAGNPLDTHSFPFVTGPAPTVTVASPASGATGVSRTANVIVGFSEPVLGVGGLTARLQNSSGMIIAATVSCNATSRRVTINPHVSLHAKTKYTVRLIGGSAQIRDKAGNPLKTTSWTFTTS